MNDQAQQPNYEDIVWPWDGDPNWSQPRIGATYDPGDDENWMLACKECEQHFPADITMGVVSEHWVTQHHPDQADAPEVALNLVWVGLGVPPKSGRVE